MVLFLTVFLVSWAEQELSHECGATRKVSAQVSWCCQRGHVPDVVHYCCCDQQRNARA